MRRKGRDPGEVARGLSPWPLSQAMILMTFLPLLGAGNQTIRLSSPRGSTRSPLLLQQQPQRPEVALPSLPAGPILAVRVEISRLFDAGPSEALGLINQFN